MKKLILSLTLAGAAALAAKASTVSSANTFGVLKVASLTKETIICVPWMAVGTGEAPVNATNLVMSSNLSVGDTLHYYNKSTEKFDSWEVDNNNAWSSTLSVSSSTLGSAAVISAAGSQNASRGDALIVVRKDTDKPIYLYGQYTSQAFTGGSITPNAWNLIAPPNTSSSAFDLNSNATWSKVDEKDYIVVNTAGGPAVRLTYKNNAWGRNVAGSWSTASAVIQPGQGAWYVSAGAEAPSYVIK